MEELCKRVIARLDKGEKPKDIVTTLDVTFNFVRRPKELYEKTGGFSKQNRGGRKWWYIASTKDSVEWTKASPCEQE